MTDRERALRAFWTTLAAAALMSTPAFAGPTSQALDAALDALRLDFAMDGVVGSDDEVQGKYREACDLGYVPACKPADWHQGGVPDLALAAKAFEQRCSYSDAVACMVDGWAIEQSPLPIDTTEDNRLEREAARLDSAQTKYRVGCEALYWPSCGELASYSIRRSEYESSNSRLRNVYERGGIRLQKQACDQRNIFSACVEMGNRNPQFPEEIDTRYSAAWLYNKSCEGGYIDGCYRQGVLQSSLRSDEENRHWFDDLCRRGHTQSCVHVAKSWSTEEDGADNALLSWTRACQLRSVEGCDVAGPALLESKPEQALEVFQRGCDLQHGVSCGRLGLLLHSKGEMSSSVEYLDLGCEAGLVDACVNVGLLRLDGQQIDGDPTRAKKDLLHGCPDDGDRMQRACAALGTIYEKGQGAERDRAIAARYFRYACDDGDMNSCFLVGETVMDLQRVSRTDRLLEWALAGYTASCEAGKLEACLPTARLLASGPLNIRDEQKAGERFQGLCTDRSAEACRVWGLWQLGRSSKSESLVSARSAFERGSELGDTESQRQLGKMFWFGQGGQRSRGKARRLFRQACKAGNRPACGGVETPDRGQ